MLDTPFDDPYATLGLSESCSDEAIQAAHRALARRYHPDVAGDAGASRMAEINVAFDRIRTPGRRAEFALGRKVQSSDAIVHATRPPDSASGSILGFGRFAGWSIDQVAQADPGYLEWLEDRREGHRYAREIDAALRAVGYRRASAPSHAAAYRTWS